MSGKRIKSKWSDRDRQDFTDMKLRAKTIPGKQKAGPDINEWEEDEEESTDEL